MGRRHTASGDGDVVGPGGVLGGSDRDEVDWHPIGLRALLLGRLPLALVAGFGDQSWSPGRHEFRGFGHGAPTETAFALHVADRFSHGGLVGGDDLWN